MAGTVLIVDDEVQLVRHLEYLLKGEGYQAIGVHDGASARSAVEKHYPDVVLVDLRLPDIDGTTLMTELQELYPSAGYIIITAHGSIRSAVESTRRGARDYLTKPFEPDELLVAVRNAMRDRMREEEITILRKRASVSYTRRSGTKSTPAESVDYRSEAMKSTLAQARQAAISDSIVLLLGESGSGKDYLARYIHDHSRRANGPFFAINCAAVAPELAESELFGHEPGAFTGARGRKRGLLELAEGGSLLLNEVGELTMPMQAKLLTFLDTRSFTRVGGETHIPVNARLIAATNRDLEAATREGRFREDLYYRINVLSIRVPPLRERKEDIPGLVHKILAQLVTEMHVSPPPGIEAESMQALVSYRWPGNVRELRNVLERALMLWEHGPLRVTVGAADQATRALLEVQFPLDRTLHDVENDVVKRLCAEALERAGGSKQGAARLLGISRNSLYRYMKRLGISAGSGTVS